MHHSLCFCNLLQTSGTLNLEFFKPLGQPRRGDWLAEKKETGQTYTTYSRRMKPPMTPTKHTDTILLVPMGSSFSEGIAVKFLSYLVDYCAAFFSGMTLDILDKPLYLRSMETLMKVSGTSVHASELSSRLSRHLCSILARGRWQKHARG